MVRLVFVLAFVLAACPKLDEPGPAATCTKLGEKCVTAKGPLGVCETAPCAAGQTAPCLKCNSQH